MKFLIDVDGVVANMTTPVLDAVNKEFDKNYKKEDITNFYFMKAGTGILEPKECDFCVELLNQEYFAENLPLIGDSVESIYKILSKGHTVKWLTTAWPFSRTWKYDRDEWLNFHFTGNGADKAIYANDKSPVQGDVFIDDKVENIIAWSSNNRGLSLIMNQPWNQNIKETKRIRRFDWSMIDDLLERLEK